MRSALSFLTILPLGGHTPEGRLGRVWFPAVGALLGLAAGTVFWSLEQVLGALVGAVGAVSLVLLLLAEVAALARLDGVRAVVALVVAGALSRWTLLLVVGLLPYVRASGLGMAAAGGRRVLDLVLGSVPAALVLLLDWRRGAPPAGGGLAAAGGRLPAVPGAGGGGGTEGRE